MLEEISDDNEGLATEREKARCLCRKFLIAVLL